MSRHLDRRTFLAAAACSAVAARTGFAAVGRSNGDVEEIARWLIATPRANVLERAARAVKAGLGAHELLAAVFVAAVREISPRVPRFNHAALVVSSIDQLTASSPQRERIALVFWAIDQLKDSQELDATSGDWKLAAREGTRLARGDDARCDLVRALEAWDADAADVALVGFARDAPLGDVVELVSEFGTRCQANLGHKAIYVAMARRMLPLVGRQLFEDVLRSVVASFFLHGKSDRAESFEASRALAADGLARREAKPGDASAARELHLALHRCKPLEAPRLVADRLRDGCADAAAWDAVVMLAAETSIADRSVAPLHALTSANALHYLHRTSASGRVRDLSLLQAAAWTCLFRDTVLAKASLDAIPIVVADPAEDAKPSTFVATWLARVRTFADDVHEIKIAAASAEEIGLAGELARPALRRALEVHLPPLDRPESDVLQRVHAATRIAVGE